MKPGLHITNRDPWDYARLNALIAQTLESHAHAARDFEPMRAYTQAMGGAFERQVQRYFSDDVLVYAGAPAGLPGSKQDVYSYGLLALLVTAVQYPFATFELLTDSAYYFDYDTSGPQDVLDHAGYDRSYSVRAYVQAAALGS